MTTRCSCTADGLTEHGKCSTEFCYACSGTLSDEQINDSSYLSRSADESSKARLGDVCLPGDDHKLGARSKHFMPLLPANATSPDPSLSCYDAEDSHLTEGKQRLHRWREAGQALRDYLTQASGQVMTSQQTDALSRGGHFDQDTAHNLCAACWNVDIPMNTPSSAAQTGCIYTNLKSGCFAQGSSGLKYSEKTAPAFHVTNCDPDSWNSTEKGICQDIQVHPDESTPGDSHILPLLDGLQGKFGHLTDDRDKKKSGIPSDRRRHRLDERTKRRQLHSFSDSSSSDSEVRQLCQSASLRRNKRLTNKQSSFGKSRPSPDDDACGLVSNATGSQLVADSKHFVGINSMHWKNVTADSRLSQSKFLGDKVEKESSLCMEDSDSFSSSSPDTNSFSDSDVVDDPVIFPPVSSLKAVNDRLISQHPDPSTLCLSSDRLFPCSSSSASSSRHHSPLPLLCCDKERHCIAAELADKTDFMPFQSKVHCPVSEGFQNMSGEDSSCQPFYLMPFSDTKNGTDVTTVASCIDNLNELTVSDASVSLDESSWDLHLENIETEADDEFECDCPVCIMNHDRIRDVWQASEYQLRADVGEESIAAASNDTELLTFSVDEPDYLSVFSHSDVLESLFQDVILQMLQIYPDLFTSHTPPPVSTDEFNKLPSFRFVQSELGSDVSCPICLCVFEDGEEAKRLPCRHSFHTLCIQAWLNKAGTCPVCRDVVMQHVVTDDHFGLGDSDDLV